MPAPAPIGAGRAKVELLGVGLRYFGLEGETEALKDISLSVAAGEFVAIIGQSGCGKSTLLSLISGIIEPTEGAILVTHDIGEAVSMAERVVVLSRRPGRVKSNHAIRFASVDGKRPAPFAARNAPEFNGYFNALWKELEVHVEG